MEIVARRSNWRLYTLILAMVLIFAWFIEKNISLPLPLILTISGISVILLFIIGISRPEFVLFVLTAYLPFNRILVGDFGRFMPAINATNILMLIIAIGWFSKSLSSGNRPFLKNTLNLPIALFCLLGFVSLAKAGLSFGSDYFANFVIPLKRWLTPIFLFFLAVNVIKNREDIRKMVTIMMIAVTVAGLMAIYEYLDIGPASSLDKSRVGGICEQANMLGGFFVSYMFILVAFLLMNWKSIRYYLLTFPIITCFYGVLVTFSRGAYLGLAAGAWAISFFRSKLLWMLVLVYFVCAFSNPMLLPAGVRYRLVESTFETTRVYPADIEEQLEASARARLVVWKGALKMIKDYPTFGIGYGLFSHIIPYYAPTGGLVDAHNTYIIIAAEMGIPALIIFLLIFAILIKNARFLYRKSKDKFIRTLALGVLGGTFGLMVVNVFGSRMDSAEVSSYFWILAGLVMRSVYIEKQNILKNKRALKNSSVKI